MTDKNREQFESNRQRINMYLPKSLGTALDLEAQEIGCNRTELMIHILLNYFQQKKAMQFADLASQIQDKN